MGLDHRIRDQRVEVVKSPSIVEVALDCQMPAYTGRLPRRQTWQAGTSLPVGTRITLTARATKPLRQASIENLQSGETTRLDLPAEPPASRFSFELPDLQQAVALNLTLLDHDGVQSQRPYQVTIAAIQDLPPQVNVLLRGIGSAVTPDARIPIEGEIQDDYGVQRCWFELSRGTDTPPFEHPFSLADRGRTEAILDLRKQRSDPQNPLTLQPGQPFTLRVRASDYCDLDDQPQIGQGDEFSLDVVTPDELLAILEARELNLKRRFEQIMTEMADTRDSLLRLQADLQPGVQACHPRAGGGTR